jgi:maltose O-acetyltransferase
MILHYTKRQRFVIAFSMKIMPILTQIVLSDRVNTFFWRLLGVKIGKSSVIRPGTAINAPFMVTIGEDSIIHGHLKARGGISIGNHVEFVENVTISTQSHNLKSPLFEATYQPVIIEDHCWLSINSIVLQGVTLGEGVVVAAGAVVTRDVDAWDIVAGVPAITIGKREHIS